ncbi:MAG TPA: disulfide bond formation protein B [Flavipsychrobacter sp.]|nr:disulfide bond formation protein B [Flavipsychrobacter sp.]
MKKRLAIYINLFGVLGLCFVLCGAYYMQFVVKEFPCPLCLLQRMCMLGVAFGLLLNLKYGFKTSHYGLSILSAVLGGAIATRQILLHICPKAGDTGYGTPVLGLHLYTWALLFFITSIVAIALLLLYTKQFEERGLRSNAQVKVTNVASFVFWLLFLLSLTNMIFALLECGFGPCPSDPVNYQLLHGQLW